MAPSVWYFGLLLGWSILQLSHGWCMLDLVKTETKDGARHTYCEHNGVRYEIGTKVRLEKECVDCTCSLTGMGCCGYGSEAGVIAAPPGCKVIARDCVAYIVREDDETKECFVIGRK